MNEKQSNISKLKTAYANNDTITGTIIDVNEFGWTVEVLGFTALLHKSQFKNEFKALPESFVGKEYSFKITDLDVRTSYSEDYLKSFKVSYFKNQFNDAQVGDYVKGSVKFSNISGLGVVVRGVNVWLPLGEIPDVEGTEISVKYPRNTQVEGEITMIDFKRGRVEISIKSYQQKRRDLFNTYKVGTICHGTISRILSSCAFVELGDFEGRIAISDIADEYVDDINKYVKIGDEVRCVILSKNETNCRLSLGLKQAIARQNEEKKLFVKSIASNFEGGEVMEATVSSISNDGVKLILGGDIPGFIPKSELRWGFSDISTEAFTGEKRNVVFLREEDGVLICSTKLLEKEKYESDLYGLDTSGLLSTLGISNNSFIGEVLQGSNSVMMFVNLYADSEEDEGKLLIDPISGNPIKILIPVKAHNLFVAGEHYKLSISAVDSERRKVDRVPYHFSISNQDALEISQNRVEDPYRRIVERSFYKQNSPSSNANQANLLEEVGQNMYDSKDRMFFELLQNADDASAKDGVKVTLQSVDGFLLLSHNGFPFDRKDYVSITSAARSTKGGKKAKTGYKGIGFKSVFTNSTKVYIKTGGFHFVFDKGAPIFSDFDNFYFKVNGLTDPDKQADYLRDNREEKEEFKGVDSIPWQLLPFWSDSVPSKLRHTIFSHNSNVCIALAMTDSNKKEYVDAILDVLDDPKFMLFLRNTSRIQFLEGHQEFNLAKKVISGRTVLQSTRAGHEVITSYLVKEGTIVDINDDAFAAIGVDIKIKKQKDARTGKEESIFVDSNNQKIPSIPSRVAESPDTLLSYAIAYGNNDILIPIKSRHSMYAYLPMVETRFPFPIYINADFILKSNRQGIQSDNVWNHFLMYHIGRSYVKWVAKEASKLQPNYLSLLLGAYYDESDKDVKDLASFFNKGYREALENDKFILNDKEEVVNQSNILLDSTGLSSVIGGDYFCSFLCQSANRLPHPNLDVSILNSDIFTSITRITSVNFKLREKCNIK